MTAGFEILDGRALRAVIFDMDGVLLDSEPLHHQVTNLVLRENDQPALSAPEYCAFLGVTDEDMWRQLRNWRDLDLPHEHYLRRFDALILDRYRRNAVARPGVVGLLNTLKARGLPLAVASSSRTDWVEICLDVIGVRRCFDVVVAGDRVRRGKPDPEIFLAAAQRLGVVPADCLVVEDSLHGVTAALAADMFTVAVSTSYTYDIETNAHVTVRALADVMSAVEKFRPLRAGLAATPA